MVSIEYDSRQKKQQRCSSSKPKKITTVYGVCCGGMVMLIEDGEEGGGLKQLAALWDQGGKRWENKQRVLSDSWGHLVTLQHSRHRTK